MRMYECYYSAAMAGQPTKITLPVKRFVELGRVRRIQEFLH